LLLELIWLEIAVGEIPACQLSPKTAKNSGRVYFYASQLPVVCITTPGCARAIRKNYPWGLQDKAITHRTRMQPASAAMATAVRDNCLLCLSAHDEAFDAYQPLKEIEIEFTQKDSFQRYGLSGWIFCSRQNT
jgi:hypothetical protein